MKQTKNSHTGILVLLLVALLIIAYKMYFMAPSDGAVVEEIAASARVESILQEIQSINFDVTVLADPKFQSLQAIPSPALNLPVGKKNPFSAGSN